MGATDLTVVSDKPSRLRDGTPAQEVEFKMVVNGEAYNVVNIAPKKGDFLVYVGVATNSPKIGEDLKAIIYSLEFQQGKDELVKVPADIQAFLDNLRIAWISHDLANLMTHYSDRYLNSGVRKGEMERVWRQIIGFTTSFEIFITDFIPAGNRAHLTGFVTINGLKAPVTNISIIKENGEWKWYGNQRDPAP
jgi:hypothetical protein